MDGYTDSAFRRVCKSVNPNILVYTEFTSADGVHHHAKKVLEKFSFDQVERPIIAQIFGKNPDTFVTAARHLEHMGFDGIDINMGCPSKKVVRSEHGVALRRNHDLAFRLIEAVAQATNLPVSVKTRLGWSHADDLTEFGKGCERAGAQAIAIHGRTYDEPYNCPADFAPIYELKQNVSIPVLANGGITSIPDGVEKTRGLDGFLIGQAAIGNPWVFAEKQPTTFSEKIPLIMEHARLLYELKGEKGASLEIRKHLLAYVRGIPHAAQYRARLVHVTGLATIEQALTDIVTEIHTQSATYTEATHHISYAT